MAKKFVTNFQKCIGTASLNKKKYNFYLREITVTPAAEKGRPRNVLFSITLRPALRPI
jgi:hypothetical protein